MGEVLVRFDHVAKRFLLEPNTNRSVTEILVRPFRRPPPKQYFWPLRDVNFEVERGQSLAVIGENGTGKSTILKLIARILEPTSGAVRTRGRIAALLELGASFHPELTGRENVFLAASIAGISKAEISRHLDEVFDFADIGPFVDVAIKHYSSGMYVRLGFAIAAHLRPDILLLDEVLAVGDDAFQRKCLQTIRDMQAQGVSVVLVSHGLGQVESFFNRALWLHEGEVRGLGAPRAVIADYLAEVAASADSKNGAAPVDATQVEIESPSASGARRWGDQAVAIRAVRLLDRNRNPSGRLTSGEPAILEIDYEVQKPIEHDPVFGIAISRADDLLCFGTNTAIEDQHLSAGPLPPSGRVSVEIAALSLLEGSYTIDVAIHAPGDGTMHDYLRAALSFTTRNPKGDLGVARQPLSWSVMALQRELS